MFCSRIIRYEQN